MSTKKPGSTSTTPFHLVLYLLVTLLFIAVAALSWLDITVEALPDNFSLEAGLALIGILVSLIGLVLSAEPDTNAKDKSDNRARKEADADEIARKRARAIYDLSISLSSTLDYNRVLRTAQNIGVLGIRDANKEARLVSAVLLFRNDDDMLHVASSHGMIRNDENATIPGRAGIIAEALEDAEARICTDPNADPELRRFATFQKLNSILIIPLHAGYQNYGILVFGSSESNVFSKDYAEWLVAIGIQTTVALQNAVLYQNILQEKERIVAADEEARKKLSRDLHDGPTQKIAMIVTRSDIIQRMMKAGQNNEARAEIAKIRELATETTSEIRHMLFTLRPLVLETQGLVPALNQLATKMQDTHNLPVVVKARTEAVNMLDESAQGMLFYVVEEAVNNAHKHARAKKVTVSLYQEKDFLRLTIADDGVGFDVDSVINPNYHERGSLGMINMRERVEVISGTLDIQSAPGRGTTIAIKIPLKEDVNPRARSGKSSEGRGKKAPLPTETRFARRSNK